MSYENGNYNGVVYIGRVKWNDDYKNVVVFKSKSDRNNFMTTHLNALNGNIGIEPAQSTSYIDIDDVLKNIDSYNYIYYKRCSDVDSEYTCAFITNWEIMAEHTTRLYIKTDIFQQYYYDTTFYQSFIERAIVSNAANDANNNYLPEPISADLEYQKELKTILSQSDWQPVWVLHSASYYENKKYHYEGIGTHSTYGEYGRFINSQQEMKDVLKMYGRKSMEDVLEGYGQATTTLFENIENWINDLTNPNANYTHEWQTIQGASTLAEMQDHREELIGLYAIPKWLYDNYVGREGANPNYADNERIVTSEIALTINASTLANGYSPIKNKKLLTSVCRAYVLANRTGLKIPFKPELFTGTAKIKLGGITMATSGYHYTIEGYADDQKSHGEVAYNSERRVGYDANTGINKALNIIGAGAGAISSLGTIAGGVATANPVTAISGAASAAGGLVRAIDQIGEKEAHFGNNGDLLRITDTRPVLRWFEVNPSVSECRAIDNFFDMYGYTIHRHQNPKSYINLTSTKFIRKYWGYVKTQDCNCSTPAPTFYENELKNIFNNGVRLWFDYSNFGNFSVDNTSTDYN